MKNIFHKIVFIGFLVPSFAFAQINVTAKIDSASIKIGQQTDIHLELTQPQGAKTKFPIVKDSLLSGLEVIRVQRDTSILPDKKQQIRAKITVTAFDSANYVIPPFRFVNGKDTLLTNELSLKVIPVLVDTLKQGLYDVKPIYEFGTDWTFIFIIIGIIALFIAAIVFFIIYYLKKKKQKPAPVIEAPVVEIKIDPKEWALKELQRIQAEKIWQQGKVKQYYTEITEVVRQYIEQQMNIIALEMTSDEILYNLKKKINAEAYHSLKELLTTADLVKFAKFVPNENDYEQALRWAFEFIAP